MQPTLLNHTTHPVLAVSLELSKNSWKIALHDGCREKASIHTATSKDALERLTEATAWIEQTRQKWQMPSDARVMIVYEAGQDGFWIQRALTEKGYEVVIIDPASLPVERQARRAKTDRLDAIKLVLALRGWLRGEHDRMHVIQIPDEDAEAQRQLVRDRGELQKESQQHRDRIRKLLRTVGCWEDNIDKHFIDKFNNGRVVCHDGSALPKELTERLAREIDRLNLVNKQLADLEKNLISKLPEAIQKRITHLQSLKGVGEVGAKRLVLELFWRDFDNRRQVGSCVGLVPQPYDSGESRVDQGISKQGNRRVRALLIEMSWLWLRYQPDSDIARWYRTRTEGNAQNKRGKRIAIVAVARRLVIALWRYLEQGTVPNGAQLKAS